MNDPFQVNVLGGLRVACQIIGISSRGSATLIDLVTLEPSQGQGDDELPAGSPLTVGFETIGLDEDRAALEGLVVGWEMEDTVVILDVANVAGGICYQFCDGEDHLLLLLHELPPTSAEDGSHH